MRVRVGDILLDGGGREVQIGNQLDRGGVGRLFSVEDNPELMCKILPANRSTPQFERKLRILADIGERTEVRAAFPTSLVYLDGGLVGYLMPKVTGRMLSEVIDFPESEQDDLLFRCCLAEDLARLVRSLHLTGIVVGDLHPSNILVADSGELIAIDCDSFTVHLSNGEVFRTYESHDYSPQMLSGLPLAKIDLDEGSDSYLLAVIVFKLLFGVHPLDDGRQDGGLREMHVQYARVRGFPYPDRPGSLPIDFFGKELADLFYGAFCLSPCEDLPKAGKFASALRRMIEAGFEVCGQCEFAPVPSLAVSCPRCGASAEMRRNPGRYIPEFRMPDTTPMPEAAKERVKEFVARDAEKRSRDYLEIMLSVLKVIVFLIALSLFLSALAAVVVGALGEQITWLPIATPPSLSSETIWGCRLLTTAIAAVSTVSALRATGKRGLLVLCVILAILVVLILAVPTAVPDIAAIASLVVQDGLSG